MKRRLYLIELFAGTHSVSKALKRCLTRSFDVFVLSVDNDPKSKPTITKDINVWDYKRDIKNFLKHKRTHDIVYIHASPPCTSFSRANTTGIRDIEGGSRNVKRTLRIIKHVHPTIWTIEDPVGLLKDQTFMRKYDKYKHSTCYCKFGKPYKKPTNIWSNAKLDLPMCNKDALCEHKRRYGRHSQTTQSGPISSGI